MNDMNLNERLIDLLAWLHGELHRWVDGLSDADREAVGRADAWAARDLVVHFTEWSEVLHSQLMNAVDGVEPPTLPDDDEINFQFFERNRGLSWAAVLDKADAAHEALSAQLRSMPVETLISPLRTDEQPLWRKVVFSTGYHTLRHMSDQLLERGESAAADALMVEGARRMTAVNDDRPFRAIVAYNLACHHALMGHSDQALETLRGALADAPDMTEFAGQDEDFASLRDDPRFQALTSV